MKNRSPWIHQLRPDRAPARLEKDITTDVAVIGAGIAGVATAFFTLKYTDAKVVLIEGFKLGHGATGHNAGQVTSYFERGFASLAEEFGLEKAAAGQKGIEDAWLLLDEMYNDAKLTIPFSRFEGHAGLSSVEQALFHLKNNEARKKAGLPTETLLIADHAPFVETLSPVYEGLFGLVSHKEILDRLETIDTRYIASLSYQKGCINSALFCEEVVLYLLEYYPERFALYEHTPITKAVLHADRVLLDAETYTVTTDRVVLCTNGFDTIHVLTADGLGVDTKFHHSVEGVVGYMSGYLETLNKQPMAISYFTDPDPGTDDPYFYLTRRPFDYEGKKEYNLISIGGPELALDDRSAYSRETDYPDTATEAIDTFVRSTYDIDPNRKIDYLFTWHGLMGFTKNGVRLVGPEPTFPRLLYNLGCNGVGILPSVFGGRRIAEYVAEREAPPSIFDVPRK